MSGIVLSASVRQNLLSLQSTASLLATTQNDLATGNKVNSALDNPTEFFTAQGLNNRASDINNLLDSINNGVQVLQAANTGITSLQSLVASAQSIANQVLQAPVGYSTKSQVTTAAITGANANNLLGTTAANATAIEGALLTGVTGTSSPVAANASLALAGIAGSLTGSAVFVNGTPSTAISASTALVGASGVVASGGTSFAAGDTLTVNGHTITFVSSAPTTGFTAVTSGATASTLYTDANGNEQIVASTATVKDVLSAIDVASGVATITTGALSGSLSTVNGSGDLVLATTTSSDVSISASNVNDLKALGLNPTNGTVTVNRTTNGSTLGTLIQAGSSLNIDGHTITFAASLPTTTPTGSGKVGSTLLTDGNGNSTISLSSGTLADVLKAIDLATGVQTASISSGVATLSVTSGDTASSIDKNGKLNLSTGTAQALTIAAGLGNNPGNALAALGLTAGTTSDTALQGQTLNIAATAGGTATNITFGTEAGQVSTLNELNAALAANNLQASIDTTGAITISTSNNAASQTIGELSGTATASGQTFAGLFALAPVQDPNSQATRASLVSQYNQVLNQINTTAQDSSFNGINLLNGDTLNLTFDETGASKLSITGVTFNIQGLGLSTLSVGTDFLDNNSANSVLAQLTNADTTLRTEASALGSNLSVVQIREDFNKNLINVLQTGASNLTLADPNEEAANSQALSTRQSIAVSALALANQSQQSVLQLLR
jgi:flagellin